MSEKIEFLSDPVLPLDLQFPIIVLVQRIGNTGLVNRAGPISCFRRDNRVGAFKNLMGSNRVACPDFLSAGNSLTAAVDVVGVVFKHLE